MSQTVGKNKELKKTSEIPGTEHMQICIVWVTLLTRNLNTARQFKHISLM